MAEAWLSIIGLGEDGLEGLTRASRSALEQAEVVFGGARHLALAEAGARGKAWPLPFDIAPVLALRGRAVAVLASGDPFWHGAGGSLAAALPPGEWRAYPAPSAFSLAAAHLGWRLEQTRCLGLHAAPWPLLLPQMQPGAQIIATLRDGDAAAGIARWLTAEGFGGAQLWVMEALGGPRQRVRATTAAGFDLRDIGALLCLAVLAPRSGPFLPLVPGRSETVFAHDGQISKSPVRAITLSALSPRRDALLWDLGAGSGAVSCEWCLAGGRAIAIETRADRLANIAANIERYGLGARMSALHGQLPGAVGGLAAPDAVFVGGGFSAELMQRLQTHARGARLVVNAVTLETEALLLELQASLGGALLRIDIAQAQPLGRKRGWQPARPLVQWSVTL